mgnify:CR=1 FL=1
MAELELQCNDVTQYILLFIDNEIEDLNRYHAIEIHIEECQPCHHIYELELSAVNQIQNLLRAVCNELPNSNLEKQIWAQTQALWNELLIKDTPSTTISFTSETTYFSSDGISFHHIQIEHTQIQHYSDPDSDQQ